MDAVSSLILNSPLNLGLLLVPMFAYKRGQVWQEELRVISHLVKLNLLCDRSFAVLFKEKCDFRDTRSLEFRGRFLEPPFVAENASVWKGCQLFRGYTDLAEQSPASKMEWIETLDPAALPSSSDDSQVTIQGGLAMGPSWCRRRWADHQCHHQRQ